MHRGEELGANSIVPQSRDSTAIFPRDLHERQAAMIVLHSAEMGKGKRIKVQKGGRAEKILKQQLRAFRKKFGRDPGPTDPVFFDPNADTPQPIPRAEIEATMREVAQFLPPHIAYAYLKTDGMLVTESNIHLWSEEDMEEWDAALEEYWRLEEEQEEGGGN